MTIALRVPILAYCCGPVGDGHVEGGDQLVRGERVALRAR